MSKPKFNFHSSPIFENISIAAWDPGKYNATLSDWCIHFYIQHSTYFQRNWWLLFIVNDFGSTRQNLYCFCIYRLFSPDFHLFESYERFMKSRPNAKFYLIDPRTIWNLWKTLRIHIGLEISPNPPSSGFIGLALLLPYCSYIDIAEYIPSTRLNGRCHYYDQEVNL